MLLPIGMVDGGIDIKLEFERDADDKQYSCYSCAFHGMGVDGLATCELLEKYPNPDPKVPAQNRPLNCGDFPVFGSAIDDALLGGHSYVPATGAYPKCTWWGIRIVGPWRDTPQYTERWDRQQQGLPVPDLTLPSNYVLLLEEKSRILRAKNSVADQETPMAEESEKREPFAEVNGQPVSTIEEGLEILRTAWSEHKKPLIEAQMEAGGPKETDPAPAGQDEDDEIMIPPPSGKDRKGVEETKTQEVESGDVQEIDNLEDIKRPKKAE